MPKVKTNRVKYPEGWELIEPTLREQLRMILMMASENVRRCGLFSKLHIRRAIIYLTFTIGGRKYLRNCMSSAWTKAMWIATLLLNGRRFASAPSMSYFTSFKCSFDLIFHVYEILFV
ncbi:hypothetical protein V6N13_097602 [Hibiscus sabdariffa]|uniref:Uncharacterized protein n=2 Tax=Hibiscus sabdariffa TaxID=183260 RepID=A0ABR2BUK7_9ROSI